MNKLFQVLIASLAALLFVPAAFAQETQKPGFVAEAPHGGILKEGKKMNLELVVRGTEIQLYPLNKMGQSVQAKDVQLTATAQSPKKTKSGIELTPSGDHYLGKLDAKSAAPVELKVVAKAKGQTQDFSFQVDANQTSKQ